MYALSQLAVCLLFVLCTIKDVHIYNNVGESPAAVGESPAAVGESPAAVGESPPAVGESPPAVGFSPVGFSPVG